MLRRSRYHIFHFIGHGVFDEHSDQGYLVMEDEQGRGQAKTRIQACGNSSYEASDSSCQPG
jgi:hypothetical protein